MAFPCSRAGTELADESITSEKRSDQIYFMEKFSKTYTCREEDHRIRNEIVILIDLLYTFD